MENGNGKTARLRLPPMHEFLVTRQEKHGGDKLIKCHSLGLGRADALLCYVLEGSISPDTGEPAIEQRVVHIFRHYIDVEEVNIPNLSVKH